MPASYAVLWRESGGPVFSGALEFRDSELCLEGAARGGAPASRTLSYADIARARIGRSAPDRLDGRPAIVVEVHPGPPILLVGAEGVAMHHEIAERLAAALEDGLTG